jgi:hypothetical protein
MNFQDALLLLKNGKKVRRCNWSFPDDAYIELLEYNSERFIYMKNKYPCSPVEGYGLQFADIEATDWKEDKL